MPVNFGNGSRFSFGNISAVDQGLFENNHDVAFQKLLDWMGNGNPNFGSTTAGRYAQQQQGIWNNRFLADQSAQTDRFAAAKGAWDQQQAAGQADYNQRLAAAGQSYLDTGKAYNDLTIQYNKGLANGTWTGGNPMDNPLFAQRMAAEKAYNDLKANPWKAGTYTAPEEQLTWTKWLEQHQGDAGTGFNELTAGQRGANPGAFQIRRNIW